MAEKSITTYKLKLAACFFMFLDHIGAAFLEYLGLTSNRVFFAFDLLLRGIGRLAFPLFIFMLVEGFFYTRSRIKYLIGLTAFAFISEIPFDAAIFINHWKFLSGELFFWGAQNVYFTLALGFMAIWIIDLMHPGRKDRFDIRKTEESMDFADAIKQKFSNDRFYILKVILSILVVAGFVFLGGPVLHTDYGASGGVLAIVMCYVARTNFKSNTRIISLFVTDVVLGIFNPLEFIALFNLLIIFKYNGEKGPKVNKWLFYIFYPAHLALLVLIRAILISIMFK